ncbi:MAG: DNA-processing protein DprA [Bacillota bacterium]|nr:DNA-processing protein DprA [Bacillota bacterium]
MEAREILIYLHSLFLNAQYFEAILDLENLEDILYMDQEDLEKIPGATTRSVEKILESRSKSYIQKLVEDINKSATNVITILDPAYPQSLRLIESSPKVLYLKGLPLNLEGVKLGVVGARKSTKYGQYAVEKFVGDLADLGATIISGMALGIDALAHKNALDKGTYTIGVLGTGVDLKYPARNQRLFERMYKEGTLISEYPLGTEAKPYMFPERNRIISGLSDGVIVIEAKEKSGSLITARLAAEQGKEVFAVPGNINSLYSVGTNRLIQDGASPLLDIEDLKLALPDLREKEQIAMDLSCLDLSAEEALVYQGIQEGLDKLDNLVAKTGLPVATVSSTIILLEMKGLVTDLGSLGIKLV